MSLRVGKQLTEERLMYNEAKSKLATREQEIRQYLTNQELNYSPSYLEKKIKQYILHDKQCKRYRNIILSFENKLRYLRGGKQ